MSKVVPPAYVQKDILRQYEVGQDAYNSFVNECITGDTSLWAPVIKIILYTWSSQGKSVKLKLGEKSVELNENCSLFARMTIAARSRPEVDIDETATTSCPVYHTRSLLLVDHCCNALIRAS